MAKSVVFGTLMYSSGNRFCLIFNVLLQSFLRGFQSLFIGFFGSLANAYVVFLRELGVDGEPYGLAVFFTGGDLNGELDALCIIFRRYVEARIDLW